MTYPTLLLTHNPLVYWRLGDASGTAAADAAGNGKTGLYIGTGGYLGATGLLTGDADDAVNFDGSSNSVSIEPPALGATEAADFTSIAWFNADAVSSNRFIVGRASASSGFSRSNNSKWMLRIDSGTLTFWRNTNGTSGWLSLNCGSVSTGGTHMVAVTCNRTTGDIFVYLDGSQVATVNATGSLPFTGVTSDGAGLSAGNWMQGGAGAEWFDGRLDEVAYIETVLTALEISDLYDEGLSPTPDALDPPTGLVILGADEDSLTLGWDAHPYAEGFEVRIDGGTPIDVGLTTLHMWDDLDPLTMYELEVRAYLDGDFSDWASIDGTTDPEPPPVGEYNVTLKLGSHEWTINYDDVLDEDAEVQVLDGLKIAWELNESDPWPAQPQGVTGFVGFYALDVDELDADLAIGTPMSIVLEDGDANVFATFHGRVTQAQASPIKRRAGLRMLYQVNGDDYTADLYEEPVTIVEAWPAESADDRMGRIVDIAATVGITLEPPADTGSAAFEELPAGTTTVGDLVADHLRQIVIDGPLRYIVTPVIVDDLLDHFECVLLDTSVDSAVLPGTFAIIDGFLTVVFPDTEADGVVDAGDVNLDTTWTRLKHRAVNRVSVTGTDYVVEATRPGPPVRLSLSTSLTDVPTAERMAELYLPDTDEALGWVADSFLFYAHRHQAGLIPPWFPDHRDDPPDLTAYVNPLAILRIPENINFAGATALAGQLSRASVQVQRRKILADFSLRRRLPTPTGEDAASYEWVYAEFPTVTYADVDPSLSYYEARLAKAV